MDFNDLLNYMIQQKASDLFITADVEPSMKINGQIVPVAKGKLTGDVAGQLLNSIMSEKQRKEFADTRECNFAIMNRDKTAPKVTKNLKCMKKSITKYHQRHN